VHHCLRFGLAIEVTFIEQLRERHVSVLTIAVNHRAKRSIILMHAPVIHDSSLAPQEWVLPWIGGGRCLRNLSLIDFQEISHGVITPVRVSVDSNKLMVESFIINKIATFSVNDYVV